VGAEPLLREATGHAHAGIRAAAASALASLTRQPIQAVAPPAPGEADTDELPLPDPSRLDWSYLASLGGAPRLVLETERGRIVLEMATEEAPHTVQTVARLASSGLYDGVPFHRVVPTFVVQGGDYRRGDGYGDPGFEITTELTHIPHVRGVIGMASSGKDTESSQFFIAQSMQPHLDSGYTAFGWVVEGLDVMERIVGGDRIVRGSIER
jgi:peptidylprolyl isomerase